MLAKRILEVCLRCIFPTDFFKVPTSQVFAKMPQTLSMIVYDGDAVGVAPNRETGRRGGQSKKNLGHEGGGRRQLDVMEDRSNATVMRFEFGRESRNFRKHK